MEMRNRLEINMGIVVPVSKLLGSSTVAELASDLNESFAAAGPTDVAPQEQGSWDEGEI